MKSFPCLPLAVALLAVVSLSGAGPISDVPQKSEKTNVNLLELPESHLEKREINNSKD